jgi:transposase
MTGKEPHAWEAGLMDNITYVGLDVHKATVCVAVAEGGRGGANSVFLTTAARF